MTIAAHLTEGTALPASAVDWDRLSNAAWAVRDNARVHGRTQVGAAVVTAQGTIFTGCNVEHRFRSHDVHAEVNALTNMAAAGDGPAIAVIVASSRDRFMPCGSCMDWIFELGGPDCLVSFQGELGGPMITVRADQLMPYYPF